MRFFVLTAMAAFNFLVLAQSAVDQLPQCARTCFSSNTGTCGQTDFDCICGNTALIGNVSCCVFAVCSQAEITETTQFAAQLCKIQDFKLGTAPSCPSGSAISSAGNGTASTTGVTSSASRTASTSTTASTGAAPVRTLGAGVGLGIAVAGLLVAL